MVIYDWIKDFFNSIKDAITASTQTMEDLIVLLNDATANIDATINAINTGQEIGGLNIAKFMGLLRYLLGDAVYGYMYYAILVGAGLAVFRLLVAIKNQIDFTGMFKSLKGLSFK